VELKAPRFSTAIGSNLYAEDRVEYFSVFLVAAFAFSALTLLVGRQEGHPACKKN